jgi:hypothetical protein
MTIHFCAMCPFETDDEAEACAHDCMKPHIEPVRYGVYVSVLDEIMDQPVTWDGILLAIKDEMTDYFRKHGTIIGSVDFGIHRASQAESDDWIDGVPYGKVYASAYVIPKYSPNPLGQHKNTPTQ